MSRPFAPLVVGLLALVTACTEASAPAAAPAQPPTSRVIVVTIDGLRWQEFFTGAGQPYFKRPKDKEPGPAERRFWRSTPAERRAVLMPFIWSEVVKKGQIFGDRTAGSRVHVTNGLWFSYPGYSEMFVGFADPRINSNNKMPNPNVSVLEWLNRRPGFEGKVAAFGSWDVLPSILNTERSGLPVGTAFAPVPHPATDAERAINQLAADLPAYWDYGPFDAPMVYAALDALQTRDVRVLYLMLGEGDEWAHDSKYPLYLDATYRADKFIERIWQLVQSLPAYANRTTLLLTTDHGRGATLKDWTEHGRGVPAAEDTWMAALGPRVPALGVRQNLRVTTSQFAATIASVVGEDFTKAGPNIAAPVAFVQ